MLVPTINLSAMDLTVVLEQDVSPEDIHGAINEAATGQYRGIVGLTLEPLASCDFNHDSRSAIVDGSQTRVSRKRLAKLIIWFDNEWAYASRMLDVARLMLQHGS